MTAPNQSSLRLWLPLIFTVTLTAWSIPLAFGANGNSADQIEQIIVTATRVDRHASDIARSLVLVQREEIESIQGQSVADLLAYQANITTNGGPRAGSQTVNIRGLGGNKVLQTIDGARFSFESGHRPSYYLDPELLQRVEALRGPVSSLWGSGALGGVISQQTLNPADLLGLSRLGGFLRTGYNANNQQSTTTLAVAGQGASIDLLASGYFRQSDDLKLGDGSRLMGSSSRDRGALGKINWSPSNLHQVQFNLRASATSGTVPANGANPQSSSNFLVSRDTDTLNANARWQYSPESELINSRVLAYWNGIDIAEQRVADGRADQTELDEYGINLINLSTLGPVTLQYGSDIYRERFRATRAGADRPLPPAADTRVWSAYAQASIDLGSSWRLDLGSRYDHFATLARGFANEREEDAISNSAALVWQPTAAATLSLRYDEAFRAPTAEELYTSGIHFCLFPGFCNGFVPNPTLEAEQAANLELNSQLAFSDIGGLDGLTLQVSLFRNRVDNFIEQIVTNPSFGPFPSPGTTSWVNLDQATIEGFEAQALMTRGELGMRLAYGQTRGLDDRTAEDVTNIPADTFVADISYGFFGRQLVAGLRFTNAAEQGRVNFAANAGAAPFDGYSITDLYATWQPGEWDAVKLNLSVNNLTDEFYQRAWSQLSEAGREIILSARFDF